MCSIGSKKTDHENRSIEARSTPEVFEELYGELSVMAARLLARESDPHRVDARGLVHEAYLRLWKDPDLFWESRRHFFAIALRSMRQCLIAAARRRGARKRGSGLKVVPLQEIEETVTQPRIELLELDSAIERLRHINARLVHVAEMRIYAGLSHERIASVLGVTSRTVRSDWKRAKEELRRDLWGTEQ